MNWNLPMHFTHYTHALIELQSQAREYAKRGVKFFCQPISSYHTQCLSLALEAALTGKGLNIDWQNTPRLLWRT